ncbi:MAG: hypothetical protein OQK32_00770 [Gammaproteobacteria bacterium]|nr:hypothetical protein [Gammaproteobacteria bacterium]MCW8923466.1 hypothetical protein [Gammaproteobacteria bacterium]
MRKPQLTVTVNEGLMALDASLVITVAQNAIISTRQSEIEKIMVKEFGAKGTVLTGASSRNTMIQPLEGSVIDLFVLLHPELGQHNTPAGLMIKVVDVLRAHYPDAEISAKTHSIVVAMPEFVFHVVPSFFRQDKGYIVADANNQLWKKTNPAIHYYALDEDNHKHKSLLLPVIRIIKYWNECNGSLFNNYYLELLIRDILSGQKFESLVEAIKYFFKEAVTLVVFTIDDPSDNGKQMDGLKDITKMMEAMQQFIDCYGHIVEAKLYESEGNLMQAYKEFGKIFGGYYPGYVDMMAKKLDANGITGIEALQILRDAT